ncbi:MAG: ABC transporter permease [Tenericutes bacterium]|nr:ABC transporter permease [Mycoplasmatota bacterium]
MFDLVCLVKRNIYTFLRDKTAVFFSFLSVIILLALYFLFIGRQYTTGGSLDLIDENLRTFLGVSIIMGGVLVINTISLSLGVMGNVISDLANHRLDGFLVTPVKRYKIILSYYISAILVTSILSLFMWGLTILYVGLLSGYWYTLSTILQASGLIIFYTFISASLMIFLTTLLKSVNAFGALSGILGTIVGFISGIYMPLFVLGKSMIYVASLVPFTHMTIILKNVLLKEPYEALAKEVPQEVMNEIEVAYGTVEIGILGQDVKMWVIITAILLLSFILMFFAYKKMNKKMN